MKLLSYKNLKDIKAGKIGQKAYTIFLLKSLRIPTPESVVLTEINSKTKINQGDLNLISKELNISSAEKLILRSSGSNEDTSNSSLAGFYKSKVCKNNLEEINNSIQEIYQDYLDKNKNSNFIKAKSKSIFSIIFQKYFKFSSSGVCFSSNPNDPTKGLVINSTFGQPNSVVEGEKTDVINLNYLGKIKSYQKKSWLKSLNKNQIKILFLEVNRIKNYLKKNLDIEFGFQKNELVSTPGQALDPKGFTRRKQRGIKYNKLIILQAREITAFKKEAKVNLDRSNIGENFPFQIKPLSFSILDEVYQKTYQKLIVESGRSLTRVLNRQDIFENLISVKNGFVYYNMTAWHSMTGLLPRSKKNNEDLRKMISGKIDSENHANRISFGFKLKYLSIVIRKLLLFYFQQKSYQNNSRLIIDSYQNIDYSKFSFSDLYRFYLDIKNLTLTDSFQAVENDFLLINVLQILKKTFQKSSDFEKAFNYFLNQKEVSSRQVIIKKEIYSKLKKISEINSKETFENQFLFDKEYTKLRLEVLDYLYEFSNRNQVELNLENLIDKPNFKATDQLKAFVKEFYKSDFKIDKNNKLELDSKINFIQKTLFKLLTKLIQNREINRLNRARFFYLISRIYRVIGQKLAQLEKLNNYTDINFLTSAEIWDYINLKSYNDDFKELVKLRKKEFNKKTKKYQRASITSFPDFYNFELEPFSEKNNKNFDGKKFYGTTCSHGTVQGKIQKLEKLPEKIKDSYDIVLTNHTDPGWIEVIARSRGLVVENGGILSHAAIVARELGVPCIVGINDVYSKLKDGQRIKLNASHGYLETI
jgi:phosphohistidine swiveling domain-containing protein